MNSSTSVTNIDLRKVDNQDKLEILKSVPAKSVIEICVVGIPTLDNHEKLEKGTSVKGLP